MTTNNLMTDFLIEFFYVIYTNQINLRINQLKKNEILIFINKMR